MSYSDLSLGKKKSLGRKQMMSNGSVCIPDPISAYIRAVSAPLCVVRLCGPHNICHPRNMIMAIIFKGIIYCWLSPFVVCVCMHASQGPTSDGQGPGARLTYLPRIL